ncbi:MAG: heavy metal translocating P-type ATPase [Candidatus Dormibacteraeota bacterium]|nr:heavy metal translocating P-type ATPase [Candidatus Dormibacteraeota bacterium]MBO0762206.1 heavy metal translocating P-type ATPase [Candidatus Dormibacteraeota bacterium]
MQPHAHGQAAEPGGGHTAEHAADASHGPHGAEGEHGGHGGHTAHIARFRRLFWVSLGLSIPVVLLSPMFARFLGYPLPNVPGLSVVPPVLGTVIFVYGGQPFLTGAWSELRSRRPGMMLLIAMAITVGFAASWAATLGIASRELDFWWELALLVTIMLLGHWLEMRSLGAATGALDALAALLPDEAERVTAEGVETVPLGALHVGDVVLVRSGARVPADGRITEGEAELDESMITGESRPVPRSSGDRVVAGTVATDSAVRVEVTALGGDTALAGIQRLVAEAQSSRSRAQALADRAAALLFYFAAGSGLITLVVWALLGEFSTAIERTVTVLVIACPHALGLAIPLVIAISTELSARQGILVKDRLALERMRTIDVVLFDKTGTLTRGEPVVTAVAAAGDQPGGEAELVRLAAPAESDSEHPMARAVVRAAQERDGAAAASGFRSLTGRGVEATVDGSRVAVGGPQLLREQAAEVPPSLAERTREWAARGAAVLHVLRDGRVIGALALEDEIRPESAEAVDALHAQGVRVAMITGDARSVAETVGRRLGVDEVLAEVLPEAKDAEVAKLQARGLRVAMVGDGVNDAPALARAEVGIAIGAGTDVAIESAGVVLAANDPRAVLGVRRLSQASYRKMWQNLAWAAGYNLAAVPLAAGVLAGIGIVLPMEVGAILMSLSTVIVALNAQLLRRLDLRPVGRTGGTPA